MAAKKNICIAMESDFQDKLKVLADKKKVSVSMLIRDACEKYLMCEDGETKLLLTIPAAVTSDPVKVESWLQQRFQAIINHFKS
jgi:hypothetical protein